MLGKLMKHEWKATRRILLPINFTIILITIVECLFLATDIFQNKSSLPLVILLLILYALSLLVLSTVSGIYLLVRFYKNLFTREGYLMFTLPVTPVQLLNSKLLVGFLWSAFNTLLSVGSLFSLGFSSAYYASVHGNSSSKGDFLSGFTYALTGGTNTPASFKSVFGYSALELLALCIVTFLIGCFFSLTMGYLAITLGQLIEKYKLACSIGFYIALYVITQILSGILMIGVNIKNITYASGDVLGVSLNIYQTVLPTTAILSLVLGVIFYIITLFVIRKKVNLD